EARGEDWRENLTAWRCGSSRTRVSKVKGRRIVVFKPLVKKNSVGNASRSFTRNSPRGRCEARKAPWAPRAFTAVNGRGFSGPETLVGTERRSEKKFMSWCLFP